MEIPESGSLAFQRFLQIRKTCLLSKEQKSISELYERTGCFLSEIADQERFERQSYFDFSPWSSHDSLLNRIKNMQIKDF